MAGLVDERVLGIDIGGSKIRLTLQEPVGHVLATAQVSTPDKGGDMVVAAIAGAVAQLGAGAVACGVGTAGDVEPGTGRITWASSTIRDWSGYPLGERLAPVLGIPVVIENDGNAATVGEHLHGAGRGASSTVGIFVGTGIGGGIVLEQELLRGARHRAGELGHTDASDAAGRACPCGATGHIEAIASATAVVRDYAEMTGMHRTYAGISVLAEAGDAMARTVLLAAGRALARWLHSVVCVVDPDVIVVGGGAIAAPQWWAGFEEGLAADGPGRRHLPPIHQAALGSDAVAIGAAALAVRTLPSEPPHRGPRVALG